MSGLFPYDRTIPVCFRFLHKPVYDREWERDASGFVCHSTTKRPLACAICGRKIEVQFREPVVEGERRIVEQPQTIRQTTRWVLQHYDCTNTSDLDEAA